MIYRELNRLWLVCTGRSLVGLAFLGSADRLFTLKEDWVPARLSGTTF
jgi:hypothetical protein